MFHHHCRCAVAAAIESLYALRHSPRQAHLAHRRHRTFAGVIPVARSFRFVLAALIMLTWGAGCGCGAAEPRHAHHRWLQQQRQSPRLGPGPYHAATHCARGLSRRWFGRHDHHRPAAPSARTISQALVAQGAHATPDPRGLSSFIWQWGQFLDHDMTLVPTSAASGSAAHCGGRSERSFCAGAHSAHALGL